MDSRLPGLLTLLTVFSLLSSRVRAESTGSAYFFDSFTHQFLRAPERKYADEFPSMSLQEVGASVSVLLGFAPPSTFAASSSSKLNQVLAPNPFNRPRAVFVLEVSGIKDLKHIDQDGAMFSSALRSMDIFGSAGAEIQLSDEDKVSVISLDEPVGDYTDKEISDYAFWMGGTYVTDAIEQLNGVLTIPFVNGADVQLHLSEKPEREFVVGLVSLTHNVRRAIQLHEDLSHSLRRPAELLTGGFHGIKALQGQYGLDGVTQQGIKLLAATLTKIYNSLQEAYEGQIVGVIYSCTSPPESGKVFDVLYTPKPAARSLAETKGVDATELHVLLVRRILAWLTGFILLVSTLLGIYFLLNMPLTRDTLLYTNVKLD